MNELAIRIPSLTPPSLNTVGGRGGIRTFHRAKKGWQRVIEQELMAAALPRHLQTVHARAVLWFPVDRGRDEGNYRALLEKATGDALTNGDWVPDDTPDHYRFGRVQFERGPAATVLVLTYESAAP